MKKIFLIMMVAASATALVSCEGKENYDYDNQGLTEAELAHTRKIIDSSLTKMKAEMRLVDSVSKAELRNEIAALKEEIQKLKK